MTLSKNTEGFYLHFQISYIKCMDNPHHVWQSNKLCYQNQSF